MLVPSVRRNLGVDLPAVHVLHTMGDGIAPRRIVDRMGPAATVVIGAGYIGVEIADALTAQPLSGV